MAIGIKLSKTERVLFCGSKWWGDPDMPENMQYPVVQVNEEGETYEYPLTFICQINCEDIASFDPEGYLPHEGMLYFFAAIDKWLGYDSPTENDRGEWARGHFVVKYAKSINFETFQSCVMVDDDDQSLTEPEMEMIFSECADDASGLKILGIPHSADVKGDYPDHINLLQLDTDAGAGIALDGSAQINLLIKESDLKVGNWKRVKAVY